MDGAGQRCSLVIEGGGWTPDGARLRIPLAVRVGGFFLAFMALTQTSYVFAFEPYTDIGIFWPSAGLCLAALLLEDMKVWPAYVTAIFVGELSGVALKGLPLPVCVSWAVAASGEPLLSALLLRRVTGGRVRIERLRDLAALLVVGVLASPSIAGLIGAVAAVTWLGTPSLTMSWISWWLGDALGVLVVAPLLVVWLVPAARLAPRRVWLEGAVVMVALALTTHAMFSESAASPWLIPGLFSFPLMLWAALRFELRGATVGSAILNVLATYHTAQGRGLFAEIGTSPLERLAALQAYLLFVTLSSLALAVTTAERRRGDRQLQDIIDNANAVIWAKQLDGRYLFVNRAFERLTHVSRGTLVGRTACDLWPRQWADAVTAYDREVLRTRHALTTEEDLPVAGTVHTFLTVRFPLVGETGALYAVGAMATDITERKRDAEALRRSEERLALVVAATHDAIYDSDLLTGITWRNDRYIESFGWNADWDGWVDRIHPDDRTGVLASLDRCFETRAPTWEYEYRLRRGAASEPLSYAHVLDNAYVLYTPEGKPERIVGALADITERRAAQDALRRANIELESRVGHRTAELAAAYQEMESFSYSISHDLRAPLRAINGFGKALEEEHGKTLAPQAIDYLHRMRAASRRMGLLIDDLLALSRAGRAEVRHERVDLTELARGVLQELAEGEPGRAVTSVLEPGLVASGDPGLLRIVMQNLLSNAWKFTSHHRTARIEVGSGRVGGENAFFVRDDGAGFDMRYAGKLFMPFERLHGTTEFPGTGIGLATIQRIVARHGGRVWASGAVEEGATFYFTLPAAA